MECEICGADGAGYIILVEGAKLSVCQDCSGSGKLLRAPQPVRGPEAQPARAGRAEMEVVDGYGGIIASARKRMGLPLEVLAEKINEKHSFLERVEHEKTLPDEKLAHKLERELGIKLLQEVSSGAAVNVKDGQGKGMTLGDILEVQMRKKK
ncbi:MAG: multiprotein bridging factor aMBF1 [Candidatus Micrarchaeia archaeon]|jgi:putative transcription factor